MKALCERDQLAPALQACAKVVPAKHDIPVFSCVRLELDGDRLDVSGTNGAQLRGRTIAVRSESRGGCYVNAARLAGFVAGMPSGAEIELSQKEPTGDLVVRHGRNRCGLATLPLDSGFRFPDAAPAASLSLSGRALARILKRVMAAASNDPHRDYLCAVKLETEEADGGVRLLAIATNGHVLRAAKTPIEGEAIPDDLRILVPRGAVSHCIDLANRADQERLTLMVNESRADLILEATQERYHTNLVSAAGWPEWRRLAEQEAEALTLRFSIDDFRAAARRLLLVAEEGKTGRLASFRAEAEHLVIQAADDLAEAVEYVPAAVAGDGQEWGSNLGYIIDCLATLEDGDAVMRLPADVMEKKGANLFLHEAKGTDDVIVVAPTKTPPRALRMDKGKGGSAA